MGMSSRNKDRALPPVSQMKTAGRMWIAALGLLFVAYPLWVERNFIASLATTRKIATADLSTNHERTAAQVQRAFAEARKSQPVEATLVQESTPHLTHAYFQLSITADTADRARADLAAFTKALTGAFPRGEENLSVSPNEKTYPAPNDASRRVAIGVLAAIVLLMAGCQLLFVLGARIEGAGRAGIIAALATPFTILIFPANTRSMARSGDPIVTADWTFVLLLLAITPIAILLGMWLSRSRQVAAQPRR